MIRAILTDIEGTLSSISFVREVLFPYARKNIENFVREHSHEDLMKKLLLDTLNELKEQNENGGTTESDVSELASDASKESRDSNVREAIQTLVSWIDADRKATPLKAIQGMIWKTGFENGDFQGHIYEDALRHLRLWKKRGLPIYVYSSGSVQAQKLYFQYSEAGDLSELFSGFFDTVTGPKKEKASYLKIASQIGLPPSQILFLSDIAEELDAAHAVEMPTFQLLRGGLAGSPNHRGVSSFDEIEFD